MIDWLVDMLEFFGIWTVIAIKLAGHLKLHVQANFHVTRRLSDIGAPREYLTLAEYKRCPKLIHSNDWYTP